MTSPSTCEIGSSATTGQRLLAGAIGGIIGGLVFGMMLAKMGMLPMIASAMMGSKSAAVGFGIHMVISIIFGLIGGALLKFMPSCAGKGALFAIVYGLILWVVGPLLIMPLMTGHPVFHITHTSSASLVGHIVFALVTMFVARFIATRMANKNA